MRVAVLPNSTKKEAVSFIKNVIDEIKEFNCQILLNERYKSDYAEYNNIIFSDNDSELIKNCDFSIVIGGDGTIIRYGKIAALYDKPIIGINFGRVGFVAGLEPEDISKIKLIFKEPFSIEERILLNVKIEGDDGKSEYHAINDAVISRGSLSRIIDLNVYLNDRFFCDYRADGLIFSTPTGSTAYALSAGGPVLEPTMNAFVLLPICPHSLSSRPVILKDDNVFTVKSNERENNEVFLTIDGQDTYLIQKNNKVIIEKSKYRLKLIKAVSKGFYRVINDKLCERII